ncbi:MAG: hypothetical protein B6227_02680 [Fusobacteriia bacterium 4572_74]|nr:MAG: hypothetical protein B6227_02680 [Fusobacteriia bacterium 4572_74]
MSSLKDKSIKEKEKELNAKILAIESDEWYKIKQLLHEDNVLDCNQQKKVGYYNFCDTLNEAKRFDNKLSTGQMIKAREIYTILENNGYNFINKEKQTKEEDVDEFIMQFMDETKNLEKID